MNGIILSPIGLRNRIFRWVRSTLGDRLLSNRWERSMRCLEEALELAQAEYVTREQAIKLLDRVYSRPVGSAPQELAGLGVCWLAMTANYAVDPMDLINSEVLRIEEHSTREKVRIKQQEKADAGVALPPEPDGDGSGF